MNRSSGAGPGLDADDLGGAAQGAATQPTGVRMLAGERRLIHVLPFRPRRISATKS